MAAALKAVTPAALQQQLCALCPTLAADAPLALAVSGGGDSLALMALAAAAFGARARVLSVDHGLRAESAAECTMVVRRAAEVGLQVEVLSLHLQGGANVQAAARAARYAAMAARCRERGIGVLLTAHHRDDQAETLLLRLARGSGLRGLCGIRPRAEIAGLQVVRPLLGVGRAELAAVVAGRGWVAAADPSNDSPHYDRTAARRLLRAADWLQPPRLAAAAAHLQQAEDAIRWALDLAWQSRVRRAAGGLLLECGDLPAELQLRLLQRGLAHFGGAAEGPALTRLRARLTAGRPSTLAGVRLRPLPGERWQLTPAPPRRH